jgi:hypothetical protein
MDLFFALLLKPLIALVVFGIPCAVALWWVRRLPNGWLRKLLLTTIHSGKSRADRDRPVEKSH